MTPNIQYKRLYSKNYSGIKNERWRLRDEAEAEFQRQIQAEQKRRQPKAKKKFKELDDVTLETIKVSILAKYKPLIDELDKFIKDAIESRKARLAELEGKVVAEPDPLNWYKVEESRSSDYHTQGWGKHKYAHGALIPTQDALIREGFVAEVRKKEDYVLEAHSSFGVGHVPAETYYRYELWANCPEWMADALGLYSMLDFIKSCDRFGVNPRVYNPFISYDTEEKCRNLIQDETGRRYA